MPQLCPQFKQELQSIQEKIVLFDAEMEKVGETRNIQPVLELRKEIQAKINQLKEKVNSFKKLEKIIGHEVWNRIIAVGDKSYGELSNELIESAVYVSVGTMLLLEKKGFTISKNAKKITLVCLTPKDLGLSENADKMKIFTAARKIGLELCPAEVGPQLRLQYTDQPNGEELYIGMEPITDELGNLEFFSVSCDDSELYLKSFHFHSPNGKWIFILPGVNKN